MFCTNCGNEIDNKAVICVSCGIATYNLSQSFSNTLPENRFDWVTTLLLCFFLGVFGVHSFYTKKNFIGVIQLLTLGGCGIWALIDFILILVGNFKDGNGNELYKR
jgi:hypothetical protein